MKLKFLLFRTRRIFTRYFFLFILSITTFILYLNFSFLTSTSKYQIPHLSLLETKQEKQFRQEDLIPNPLGQSCLHPNLDINDETLAKHFVGNSEPISCDSEEDWICTENGEAFICKTVLVQNQPQEVTCTLTFIHRISDDEIINGEEVTLKNKERVLLKSDFFHANCKNTLGIVWKGLIAGISRNAQIHQRAGEHRLPKVALGLDVLIWSVTSLSKLTFMRKLPKTYEYLTKVLNAVVFKGYNVVGEGSSQAFIPILTGKSELELPDTRRKKPKFVNVYPMIWKDFKTYGYVTAFAEDEAEVGIFNGRLNGFKDQPTDHYMRTFYLALGEEVKKYNKYCVGSTPKYKVMMNWILQFFDVYVEKPKFALTILKEFSNKNLKDVGLIDEDLRQTIYLLQSKGHLNTTLFILLSDQGPSFPEILETQQGKQNKRLPFFAVVYPTWLDKLYPQISRNLRQNSRRLITPYDIYPTLYDILYFENAQYWDIKTKGISLFEKVPLSRTCADAHVEPHWCTCLHWKMADVNSSLVKLAALAVVKYINSQTLIQREICEVAALDKIIWAQKYVPFDSLLRFKKTIGADGFIADLTDKMKVGVVEYHVKIRTQPNGRLFEAFLNYDVSNKIFKVQESEISRVDNMEIALDCVGEHQTELRKFCSCKEHIELL